MYSHHAAYEAAACDLSMEDMERVVPGFTRPTQARTRLKAVKVIAATAALLRTHSFGEISVQQIAATADCSVTSIYARFRDKGSILPAVQVLVMATFANTMEQRVLSRDYSGGTLEDFCRDLVLLYEELFLSHANFIRATLIGQGEAAIQQADAQRDWMAARTNMIVAMLQGRPPEETIGGVVLALRLTMSVFRDRIMVGEGGHGVSTKALTRLFAMTVRADPGGSLA